MQTPSNNNKGRANTAINHDFAAPLGAATAGRLVFPSGAARITLAVSLALPDLCRARFDQQIPAVYAQDGVVTIRHQRHSFLDWLTDWRQPLNTITLNGSIPWDIEIRGGVSHLTADLRHLSLRALDLGSISQTVLTLPRPTGAAYIYISGSVSNVVIHRPADVALRAQIDSSASNLRFDDHLFGAIAGGMCWQTHNYNSTADRYEISISGSASHLTIDAR